MKTLWLSAWLSATVFFTLFVFTPETQAAVKCERFTECLQKALWNAESNVDKVLYASQALKLWNPSVPKRDLLNALKLRSEALVSIHEAGATVAFDPLEYAQADYERFLTEAPDHWLPLSGLGRIAELKKETKKARQLFARSVKSRRVRAYFARARFYVRLASWSAALQDVNKALAKDKVNQKRDMGLPLPERGALYGLRSQVQAQLNHMLEARFDKEEACKLGHQASCAS